MEGGPSRPPNTWLSAGLLRGQRYMGAAWTPCDGVRRTPGALHGLCPPGGLSLPSASGQGPRRLRLGRLLR